MFLHTSHSSASQHLVEFVSHVRYLIRTIRSTAARFFVAVSLNGLCSCVTSMCSNEINKLFSSSISWYYVLRLCLNKGVMRPFEVSLPRNLA